MSITDPRPRTADLRPGGGRNPLIDAVRAGSMIVVVLLHTFMVGAGRDPGGELVMAPALLGQDWFAPLSWVAQVMPLFFLAGGYCALASWRRKRAHGWAPFVAARVHRLLVPAAVMIGVVAATLALARFAGAGADVVAEAGFRIGQPLWFLAVYLGVSALVPALAGLHERLGLLLPAALAGGIVAVDAFRIQADLPALGYLNLALVWPFALVLGFHFLDGFAAHWRRRHLWAGALAPLAVLLALTTAGGYSPDMIVNLNPPTVALALLGASQFFLLRIAQPRLEAAVGRIPALVRAADSHAMTLYLWHMPALMALTGALVASGVAMPAAHSAEWWATRPAWLALATGLVVPLSIAVDAALARIPGLPGNGTPHGTTQAVVCGVVGVLVVLVGGFTLALASLGLLGLAVWLAATGRELRLNSRVPR